MLRTRLHGPLLLGLLAATPARAAAQAPPDSLPTVRLDPLVVTVLRTPVELVRAPFAVSVNRQEEIQRAKPGLALDEALRAVPGVQVDNRYNYALGERISIRGFGARAQFGVRGVKVLLDGIPATFPDGQTSLSHVDLGLLGRAEVIRGPAAALYGNTAGGVIDFRTEAPPPRPFSQEVALTVGSSGLLRLQSTSAGTSGRSSYLLGLSRLDYGGYREYSSAENQRVNGVYGWEGSSDRLRVVASGVEYDARNPGSLSAELLRDDRSQAYANNRAQRTGERGHQGQLGATWWRALGGGAEWETTAYGIARGVDNPIPNTIVALDRKVGGLRTLLRSSPGRPLGAAVGVEGALQADDRQNYANQQGERGTVALDQLERVRNAALFGEGTARAGRWTALAGARWDWFRFSARDRLVSADDPDDSGSRTMAAVSPSLGLSYELADAATLYGNVATAFETPTTTELANRPSGAGGFNPDLQPQRTLSWEAGAKGRLGPRGAYQLSLYRASVRDALIPFEVPSSPGRQFFRNAGSAVHRGVEVGLTLLPLPGARVRASYSYTDARFRDYGDLGGNRVPGVAPHQAQLVASWDAPGGLFLSLEERYASRLPVNDANSAWSDAYAATDLLAGLRAVRLGRAELEPFAGIANLLDAEYNASVTVNAFGGRYYEPAPGRAFHAGVRLGF